LSLTYIIAHQAQELLRAKEMIGSATALVIKCSLLMVVVMVVAAMVT